MIRNVTYEIWWDGEHLRIREYEDGKIMVIQKDEDGGGSSHFTLAEQAELLEYLSRPR